MVSYLPLRWIEVTVTVKNKDFDNLQMSERVSVGWSRTEGSHIDREHCPLSGRDSVVLWPGHRRLRHC